MKNLKQCLVFAHRGANREAAENTRSAFDKALEYAIDGIETDVQLSRDEVAVLWHDRFLNKLGLPDKRIDDFDYSQLCVMNFSGHFSANIKAEGILRLQEFLDAYRTRCHLLIEIKNRDWETASRHEIKVRQTLDMTGKVQNDAVMVSSFNLQSLVYAHQYRPNFPLVYNLEPEQTLEDVRHALTGHHFIHGFCLSIEAIDDATVELLRRHDKCIAVYTCNSDAEINKALELGVDILISDVPHKALSMRDARRNNI